jgi:hypothetical protein
MIREYIGNFNQPSLEVRNDGGHIQLDFFTAIPEKNEPAQVNFYSTNKHGLGYNAYIVQGEKRKEYQKEAYITAINQTIWINEEEKTVLINFINQYIQ